MMIGANQWDWKTKKGARKTTTKKSALHDSPLVLPVYWEDVRLPERLRQNRTYMKGHSYAPNIGALDIETSTDWTCSWMYLWCFAIDDIIVYGRTVDELKHWLRRLAAWMDLRTDYRLLVYIHNAKYDLTFLRHDISLESRKKNDFIARTRRQIIRCCFDINYEVRDSAVYTEMPLEMVGAEIGMQKVADYDYDKIRTPETELTEDDLKYCARDAHILTTYFRIQWNEYGAIGDIPVTATGRDRRLISQTFNNWAKKTDGAIRRMIYARQLKTQRADGETPTEEQQKKYDRDKITLDMLRRAFFGGFCYCNDFWADTEIKRSTDGKTGVVHADQDACYAAMMMTKKFPIDRFVPCPSKYIPRTQEQMDALINASGVYRNKAMLIRVNLYGVEARIPDFGFLPSWIKYHLSESGLSTIKRASRVQTADSLEVVLTDVDFRELKRWYKVKNVQVVSILWTAYGYLPEYIRDAIIMLYQKKKETKSWIKEKRKNGTATMQDEILYSHVKTMLARMYGVFVQDPIRMIYEWNEEKKDVQRVGNAHPESAQFNAVLYQWGVWTAAHARDTVLQMAARIGTRRDEDGRIVWDRSIIYSDTDCLRWIDNADDGKILILHGYNAAMRKKMAAKVSPEKVRQIYEDYGVVVYWDTMEGCGEWDIEEYQSYKQIGIKQYAVIDQYGHFDVKLAGLPKKQTYFAQFDNDQERMDAVSSLLYIPSDQSALKKTMYINHPVETDVIDCTGVQRHVSVPECIILIPTAYQAQKDSLEELLEDCSAEEIAREFMKCGIAVRGRLQYV